MRLSTKSRYGTRLLIDIAENSAAGPVSVSEIAERTGISAKYMEKLLRRLRRAGLVRSKRGPKGGHMLARPAAEITVGDIVRALEEWVVLTGCSGGKTACTTCCRTDTCPVKDVWAEASEAMFSALDRHTLQSLLGIPA